jgi:CubicO group peptidase (beta-lactamase class C family)
MTHHLTRASIPFALAALVCVEAPRAADPEGLPRVAPASVGLKPDVLQGATALLRQYVTDKKIAGAVAAVARQGKLAYFEAVGVQDLQTATPMSAHSLFRIYSMTKPVTSVAAMILFEEGKFALTDPVSKYLPEFKQVVVQDQAGATRPPAREITVEDLFLHISGLNHRTSDVYRKAAVRSRAQTLPRFIENIVRTPLMEDPHTRYRYSEATTVLGRLVEIWSGKPLDVFMGERIFRPLGMTDATFWVQPAQQNLLATVYGPGLAVVEMEEVPFTVRPALLEGAVGIVCSVPDYLRFSQMLLNKGELDGKRVLKRETVEMMVVNRLPEAILKTRGGTMGWGLANVNVQMNETSPVRGEYGWDGTGGTIFWVDPVREMVTILMTQSSPANPDSIRQRFKAIVQQAVN